MSAATQTAIFGPTVCGSASKDELEQTVQHHLQRAAVYRLLATALVYPSKETLADVRRLAWSLSA
ncbi:MAG: hypothetical protein N3C12_11650 [Candidatus Binatia bacterium]|nr:hypothetical protein [Candidatus Binatia bacterium]